MRTPNVTRVALRQSIKTVASIHLAKHKRRAHEHDTKQHGYTDKHREGDHWVYEYGHEDHHDAAHHHESQADHHKQQAAMHSRTKSGNEATGHDDLADKHQKLSEAHSHAASMHNKARLTKANDGDGSKGHTMRAQAAEHDVDDASKKLDASHKEQKVHNVHRDHHLSMARKHDRASEKHKTRHGKGLYLSESHAEARNAHLGAAAQHHAGGTGEDEDAKSVSEQFHAGEGQDDWHEMGKITQANKSIKNVEKDHLDDYEEEAPHKVDTSARPGGNTKPKAKGKKK
jgi:hypothetical protein